MTTRREPPKNARCAYVYSCYLADDLKCYGYRTDCALYQKTNGHFYSESRFHAAMDKLIDATRLKHQKIEQS